LVLAESARAGARKFARSAAQEAHEAAVSNANVSLQAAMQHLLAEESRIKEMAAQQRSLDLVQRTTVMHGGSIIVGVLAVLAWLGTALGGTVLVHPLISILLVVGSLAFYMMSKVDA
jgi:hypothetical protein